MVELTDNEFKLFQKFIFKEIGVSLGNSKKFLVKNRLSKQLALYKLDSFSDYYRLVQINSDEKINMLNLITTNETYFFRETSHFDFLRDNIIKNATKDILRVWSAASSVGAEAYSIAMLLDSANLNYEIIGSDINTEVVKKANIGLYPLKWMDKIPSELKLKYCLNGKGKHEGWFLVDKRSLQNISFVTKNLIEPQPDMDMFNIIFLRNVLIYFSEETRELIIKNILKNLKIGGYLIISLTEYIHDLDNYGLEKVQTSIFKKVK
ncbi:CheR family methyltransferase [Sulfurimonas sp.]